MSRSSKLQYFVSALCFALIVAIGIGYLKFLIFDPVKVAVTMKEKDTVTHLIKLDVGNEDYCDINKVIVVADGVPPIQHTEKTFVIPAEVVKKSQSLSLIVNYDCTYWIFHKSGDEVVMASLNN